jgi:two-component system, cell cycle sensor histidine kinase and response regulator CckA
MSPEPLLPHEKELKALRRLSEAVAHDVNNLLSGILGYCELLKCEPASDSLKPQIEEMSSAGRRIASLIRILLAIGDKYLPHPETLDLNKILLEIEKLIPRILGSEIHFTTAKAPELWPVYADPAKLKLALIALALDMKYLISNNGMIVFTAGNLISERERSLVATPGSHHWVVVTATSRGSLEAERVQALHHRLTPAAASREDAGDCGAFGFSGLVNLIGGRLLPEILSEQEFSVRMLLPTAPANAGI